MKDGQTIETNNQLRMTVKTLLDTMKQQVMVKPTRVVDQDFDIEVIVIGNRSLGFIYKENKDGVIDLRQVIEKLETKITALDKTSEYDNFYIYLKDTVPLDNPVQLHSYSQFFDWLGRMNLNHRG